MPSELSASILIPLSVQERKALILYHSSFIDANHIADEDLHIAYKYGKTISLIVPAYFQSQIVQDQYNGTVLELDRQYQLIYSKTDKFANDFIEWLKIDFENKNAMIESYFKPQNLFELCGAKLLITSNSVTRSLSTKMGKLWEEIANISPYVIIPEVEFGIRIQGIDIVILTKELIRFAQLKTLKGTLTGSQKNRAKKELEIHDNPLFISAFDLGKWTFNDTKITRIAGEEFWNNIHIDYNIVEEHVKTMLIKIDKAFAELATR